MSPRLEDLRNASELRRIRRYHSSIPSDVHDSFIRTSEHRLLL